MDLQVELLLRSLESSPETTQTLQTVLADTYKRFLAVTREHQSALEELRSAHRELRSNNAEMESVHKELQTSSEELQALHEELHTANVRLTETTEELDHSNGNLWNLFDSTDIATVVLDRNLIVRSFSRSMVKLYNLIPSDCGRRLTDISSRLNYDSLREDVTTVLANLEPLERRVDRSDVVVHYIIRIVPYRERDHVVSGVLVSFIDVSSIVQAEAALVAADARKDVFLATLAHELRNPLAPVRMVAQLLQSPHLTASQLQEARNIIARQVGQMSTLLDDLLDVSRITRGFFVLKTGSVDIEAVIDEAVESAQAVIDAKNHTLRVEYPPDRIQLKVDAVRLTQVVTNLLTNAAKYTPPGGFILLAVRIEVDHIVICVRDNGIGLSPEDAAVVFDMFTRVESDLGRKEGGLGVGLALATGIVELHGGRLLVKSAGTGQGCEFLVCLPLSLRVAAPGATRPLVEVAPSVRPRRILVADDNPDIAETSAMLLRLSGHEVHIAHSGTEALKVAANIHPDVGILDIGMSDMTGYDVALRLRHETWGKNINLIAVTGWGKESDKQLAKKSGFDHHLTKPVDPDELERLVAT